MEFRGENVDKRAKSRPAIARGSVSLGVVIIVSGS